MLYAKKGNRQIEIIKDHKEKYSKLGYTILEVSKGKKKVISKPENVKDLKEELAKKDARIKELEAEIGVLKAK